ncbi:conserved unknown protein [Ectocarpus siliculosus]|uniref:WSC domain-containing protein n=1 Tax=Ectocarpus siliculosus TaxID=2880 RepID=D7FZB0_ECTSI|nr:conserved unknown protein [Ectocarpus siliculosus]|eukprot:CBJ32727.1 conserved unknown protein [Ectocarpus siliculosus]
MAGMRFNSTPAVIAAAWLLASYQTGVQSRHLRSLDSASFATDSNRDYTHLGCFVDNQSDRVLGHKLVDEEVDTEFCYDYCLEKNAPFMATQWGIECWCATEVDLEYERHGEAEELCDYKCGGDNNEICGGYYAFDLYEIESFTTIDGPPEGAMNDDIVKIIEVPGANPGGAGWADSYSVGSKCYMSTTFDHGIGEELVDTPIGEVKIRDLYDMLEAGPGSVGRPLYNDIQCGNGPANDAADETECPGLVMEGPEGCGQIGPKWDLSELVET